MIIFYSKASLRDIHNIYFNIAAPRTTLSRPRISCIPRCAPTWNPQNVPNPKVLPSKDLTAEDAVSVQLEALKNNNQPWPNHGIQTMYEFGADIGGLDPSWYFGFQKDLYHLDHFMGQFMNQLGDLVDCKSFQVEVVQNKTSSTSSQHEKANCDDVVLHAWVDVNHSSCNGTVCIEFRLARREFGSRKGAYMTKMVRRIS